jgi:hypothetical protein
MKNIFVGNLSFGRRKMLSALCLKHMEPLTASTSARIAGSDEDGGCHHGGYPLARNAQM